MGALIETFKSRTLSVSSWKVINIAGVSPIGQDLLLQVWMSLASPTHSFPPCFGSGSLQRRLRIWTPPPQVRVHVSHGDQGPQLPLTADNKEKTLISFYDPYCISHLMVGWPELTRARRLLTLLSLSTLSYTAFASKLGGGGVTQTDTGDDTSTTGDRAG